jgi:hypothetical protein
MQIFGTGTARVRGSETFRQGFVFKSNVAELTWKAHPWRKTDERRGSRPSLLEEIYGIKTVSIT